VLVEPPLREAVVEYHSIWNVSSFFAKWSDFAPEMNVADLYWRDP
jgi:hypothetical protein